MRTVRGKELAPCYYPYQPTAQQPSDDDLKTSCMGSGRISRQRSPTKDDLSPSRWSCFNLQIRMHVCQHCASKITVID
jgi:hypothetical protein